MAEKPTKDLSKGRISIIIVGMINAGIVLLLIGLWLSDDIQHIVTYDLNGYDFAIALFGTVSLVFSIYAILNKYLTEGMLFIITALTAMVCMIMKYSDESVTNSLIYMAIAYLVCTAIFHLRKEYVFEIGSAIVGIALLCICIPDIDNGPFYTLISLAGLLILIAGCLSLAGIGPELTRARNITVPKVSSINYPTTVTYSAGTFLSCLVLFSISLNGKSDGMVAFKLIVAFLTIFAGIYGMSNGCQKRGIDIIVLSVFTITGCLSDLYGLGKIPYLSIILAVPMLTSAVQEYQEKDPIKCLCSILFATTIIASVFVGSSSFFTGLVFLTKIVATYDSVTSWIIFETGYAPEYMRHNKGSVTFDE